jgi:cation transport regulator ChaB
MPYKSNRSLPKGARKSLTKHGQSAFRKAFNSAAKRYPKESTAFKVAWSAAKKAGGKKKKR